MPYSITTKDGITINNIPDDIAPDADVLKQKVLAIRSGGPAVSSETPQEAPQEQSLLGKIGSGIADVAEVGPTSPDRGRSGRSGSRSPAPRASTAATRRRSRRWSYSW